jgi:transcription elongation GreA/GreB family factor
VHKPELIEAYAATLRARLASFEAGSDAAQAGARVDGTHRPASRGERGAVSEQAALAHGLRVRAGALRETLRRLAEVPRGAAHRAGPGTLVGLEDDEGAESWWAILPGGQGDRVAGATVVSPESPIARALAGAEEGDEVRLRRGGELRDLVVVSVG